MLKRLEFENSYCYRNRVVFDMSADMKEYNGSFIPKDAELSGCVYHPGGKRGILPVAAIYGKNAGGKTKLIHTMHDMASDALGDSYNRAVAFSSMSPYEQIYRQRAFSFADKKKTKIFYSVCVIPKGSDKEYLLEYSLGSNGVTSEKVAQRGLRIKDDFELLYERSGSKVDSGVDKSINEYTQLLKLRKGKRLWFSQIAPSHKGLSRLYEWFRYVRDGVDFNDTNHQESKLEEVARRIADEKDEPFRKMLLSCLKALDTSITNVTGEKANDMYYLWVFHRKADNEDSYHAPWIMNESDGIRKFIEQLPVIAQSLEKGMPFICDEFDRKMHPVAFRQLVWLFNDKDTNPNGAQLIFTAHDTIALDSNFLRRDEVHIVDKDMNSTSHIKRLSEHPEASYYPDMEFDFRKGVYDSIPGDLSECFKMAGETDGEA